MRIIHITAGIQETCGVSQYVVNTARAQQAAGHDVTIVTTMTCGYPVEDLKVIEVGDPVSTLERLLATDGVQVVHLHMTWTIYVHHAARWCQMHQVPYVFSPHGTLSRWAMHFKWWKKIPCWWLWQRRDLKCAAAFHVTAASEESDIRRLGFTQPVVVAPLGVSLESDNQIIKQSQIERVGVESRCRCRGRGRGAAEGQSLFRDVVFVGRIHPVKNLDSLVRAWAIFRRQEGVGVRCRCGEGEGVGVRCRCGEGEGVGVRCRCGEEEGVGVRCRGREEEELNHRCTPTPMVYTYSPRTPTPMVYTYSPRLLIAGSDDVGHQEELVELVKSLGLRVVDFSRELKFGKKQIHGGGEVPVETFQERLADCEADVVFTGPVYSAAKDWMYAHAWVSVLPSHSENFGGVVIEALAQGTPVIASTGTPWRELEEWKCGRWIDPTPEKIAEALMEMLAIDEKGRESLSTAARELVRQKYSWKASAAKVLAMYEKVKNDGK